MLGSAAAAWLDRLTLAVSHLGNAVCIEFYELGVIADYTSQ